MAILSFKDLAVWQRSMQLVQVCCSITDQLPKHEIYGIASQLTRAAVSVPSNIAEGYRRKSRAEYL